MLELRCCFGSIKTNIMINQKFRGQKQEHIGLGLSAPGTFGGTLQFWLICGLFLCFPQALLGTSLGGPYMLWKLGFALNKHSEKKTTNKINDDYKSFRNDVIFPKLFWFERMQQKKHVHEWSVLVLALLAVLAFLLLALGFGAGWPQWTTTLNRTPRNSWKTGRVVKDASLFTNEAMKITADPETFTIYIYELNQIHIFFFHSFDLFSDTTKTTTIKTFGSSFDPFSPSVWPRPPRLPASPPASPRRRPRTLRSSERCWRPGRRSPTYHENREDYCCKPYGWKKVVFLSKCFKPFLCLISFVLKTSS